MIDKRSSKPVYEQVVDGIERGILLGLFPTGTQLPSVRELSQSLGINPNTIQKSYAELTRRGVICPSPGSGCFVTDDACERLRERARARLEDLRRLAAELLGAGVAAEELIGAIRDVCDTEQKGGREL